MKEANLTRISVQARENINKNIKNIRIKGVLVWQKGVVKEIWKGSCSVALFTGDMNVLSTWIGSFLARLMGKKVVFWGHGIYGNESIVKLNLRLYFLSLANLNIVYGERAKKMMREIWLVLPSK